MRALLSLMLVLSLTACDNGNDNGGGVDTAPAEDTATPEDNGGGGCTLPDLTGKAFRITVLESQQPTEALNPTFAVDIATYVNILVFHIVEHK